MKLLLDTHALIWWLANNPTLSENARTAIADPENLVFVSAVSAWEIAIKKSLGKLDVPGDLAQQITKHNFQALPISIKHGIAVGMLPWHHKDPFDRMLIAQAIDESAIVITRDRKFKLYDVSICEC